MRTSIPRRMDVSCFMLPASWPSFRSLGLLQDFGAFSWLSFYTSLPPGPKMRGGARRSETHASSLAERPSSLSQHAEWAD